MPYALTSKQKSECKVIIMLLAIAMLMQRIDEQLNREEENPAISNCTKYIDSVLAEKDKDVREAMVAKVNTARIRLTKKTHKLDSSSSLTGAIRLFTGGLLRVKEGTHLAYIKTTFKRNLSAIENRAQFNEDRAKAFERELRKVLKAV